MEHQSKNGIAKEFPLMTGIDSSKSKNISNITNKRKLLKITWSNTKTVIHETDVYKTARTNIRDPNLGTNTASNVVGKTPKAMKDFFRANKYSMD